jgi:hypothetical protein
MFEGTDSVFKKFNISLKHFSPNRQNLPMQNSYCDHRNFDSVKQPELAKSKNSHDRKITKQ